MSAHTDFIATTVTT